MIRRFLLLIVLSCIGFGPLALAADVPSQSVYAKPKAVKVAKPPKVAKKRGTKPVKQAMNVPKAKPDETLQEKQVAVSPDVEVQAGGKEILLSWVLDPLSANADGIKREGSASVEGNLVVLEPGYVTSPYMVIELSGHIIKTTDTTARIDIKIAGKSHSVTWPLDDVKSGKFTIKLDAPMAEGKLPAYLPVSAIAFVTNAKKAGAAMVSLEKITIRLGKVRLSVAQ
jgi:hypothetical protein